MLSATATLVQGLLAGWRTGAGDIVTRCVVLRGEGKGSEVYTQCHVGAGGLPLVPLPPTSALRTVA